MGWPWEWLYQRGRLYEGAYVHHKDRLAVMTFWMALKELLVLAALLTASAFEGWPRAVGVVVLSGLATIGAISHMRRGQAYRNGWMDRGSHLVTMHSLVCNDPIAEATFQEVVTRENLDVAL